MLVPIVLAAIVVTSPAASASAAPSPVPSGAPLKEIIRVRASAVCSEFATHANSAIDSTTRNDIALGGLITTLRSSDFGTNELTLHQGMDRLHKFADAITKDWKDGEREVSILRDLAKKTTDPDEAAALKDSADSLGGALWRQRQVARDVDGFLSYLDARQMSAADDTTGQMNQTLFGAADVHDENVRPNGQDTNVRAHLQPATNLGDVGLANDPHLPSAADQALAAARDFEGRLPAIIHDEISAALHVTNASDRC